MCAFTATMYHECAIASLFPRSASETNRERNEEEGGAVVTEELYDDVQQQTPPPPPPKPSSPLTVALPPIPITAEEEEEEMEREVMVVYTPGQACGRDVLSLHLVVLGRLLNYDVGMFSRDRHADVQLGPLHLPHQFINSGYVLKKQ